MIREVFTWGVASNPHLLWFCITRLSDWPIKFAPLCHPIRSKSKTNRDSLAHVFPRFASATCVFFEFWLVLYCLCPFWLAAMITLVLVLRHSTKNRSTNEREREGQLKIFKERHRSDIFPLVSKTDQLLVSPYCLSYTSAFSLRHFSFRSKSGDFEGPGSWLP